MSFWENAVIFVILGCVVYFPVLLVGYVRQAREISRLRGLVEGIVEKKRKPEKKKIEVSEYEPQMWTVTDMDGGR